MTLTRLLLAAALLAAPSAMPMNTALAQTTGGEEQPPVNAESFSQDELKTFAMASLEVQRISQAYQPVIEEAEDSEQKQAIQQRAIDEMRTAVTETGLSLEKYNQIVTAVRNDPNLAAEVRDHMMNQGQ
ncbi:MAG: DUF4168 domain-containing protein [Hyphomicrobiales bacterium]|nr:DUF4168 domain-containing protein [Hyphomicrobiales bacterium]